MAKKKSVGNGSGTVYPRRNKAGKITSYLGAYVGPDGKRRYVSAKTKTEAQTKLRKDMADADQGLVFDAGTLTVAQYMDRWLPNIKGTVRQRSWERYEQLVRVHIKPGIGAKKVKDLTRAHVKSFYSAKREAVSARTVQYVHTTLHKALKDAVADGLVPRNVSDGLKPSTTRRHEIDPLTTEQARALLDAAKGDRLEALYVLAVHYGLRKGELLGLKWADVDLTAGVMQVRRTMSDSREEGTIEEPTKSGKGRRVELSQTAVNALKSRRKAQMEEQLAAGSKWRDNGLIFATAIGTPITGTNLTNRHFNPLLRRAGLPRRRFHDLRHTCATIRFMKGQHPKRVQELLGHASVAITLDIYSHLIPGLDGGDDPMEEALG
ncbi:MAG: site-specific integrase [Actinomycetota bacterium]|nr:site-specific integrase [Actinomycetota bacterium]